MTTAEEAGTTVDDIFSVACGDGGVIRLSDIQLEGSKRMNVTDFLRGRKIEKGTKLG